MYILDFDVSIFDGLSIQKCLRNFVEHDILVIPSDFRDQEADGDIFLKFSNDSVFRFSANTEKFSIDLIKELNFDSRKALDLSSNNFWKKRIGKSIHCVKFLFGECENPYGLQFEMDGAPYFVIEYVSESEYEFDAIRVRG